MIFLIPLFAIVVGFLLIALAGARPSAEERRFAGAPLGLSSEDAWLAQVGAESFERMLAMLFSEMKFEVSKVSHTGTLVDLWAENATPITGVRLYVRGVYAPPLGMVGEDEVRWAIDTARAEHAGKGIVVTPGQFTDEARAAAAGASVDLVDGRELAKLLRKHLPQVAAAKKL